MGNGAEATYFEFRATLRITGNNVDVFCGYRSNSDNAGFEVSHDCLV
jgi:hypothetical protein